ncbi:hypothetical protein MLD38_032700 [Melastoma candidum]|uniref:Uncharacterized protein n=1 Tax=Melastoma candidum TaxID=119954 RepID=A0ACB9M6F6_9MYRT|nr:hypothetical protein MLD38_032700 [Melastoma candidum]
MGRFVSAALALALVLGTVESFDFHEKELESEDTLWELYERWRSHHTASRSLDEKSKRFGVFKQNVMHVQRVNKEDRPYKLKLNMFADLTNHEFRTMYAGSKVDHHSMFRSAPSESFSHKNVKDVPNSVDWRKAGAVTPVKNQGQCGSCWAFSTVAALEGINFLKTKKLVSLSEQELVDCDKEQNQGCNGGLMENAFEFVKKNGGITSEENYPYEGTDGTCNTEKSNHPVISIDGHETVPANDENALLKAVSQQPVSVAIDAGGSDMQFYSEGVFSGSCGTQLNHGVTAVGYGTTLGGTKYWIVKNSWGPEWGEKGYIRMKRGISDVEGICGIAMQASYPIKKSSGNPQSEDSYGGKDEL